MYTWERLSLFIRENPIHSSERALHMTVSIHLQKISGYEPQDARRQDELIVGKLSVVK
jgi:hypothetical protein